MAEAGVTFLLEQLKEVVVGFSNLIAGAEKEFDDLKTHLESLKAFLTMKADAMGQDLQLQALVLRITNAVYDVEDTIDTCLTKAIENEVKSKTKTFRKPSVLRTFNLAKKVRAIIEEKVEPLIKDPVYAAYREQIAGTSGRREDPPVNPKTDKPIKHNRVVGFDDEESIIIGHLYESTDQLDVIPIVGVPGLGKTTLAWKVYHNNQITYDFPIRIWVYVSQTFNRRDVFLQILKQFAPNQDTSSLKEDELAIIVRSCLEKEKFLLVLDDVWSVGDWNKIKEALPENNVPGKVLITTRRADVGMEFKVHHNLRFLDEQESWNLLQYEVFGDLDICTTDLGEIGRQIARKCDGVPLMIVVVGGILLDQLAKSKSTAVDEWRMVADHMSEALQNDKERLIENVVELSYRRLSDELKECFVFLGTFPEDYEIPAKMLCGLWIAEGFILKKNGRSLEESAEDNMNDLICRNLLKAGKINEMGKVKTCRVHDIIRAFCIAISKENNLFQDVKRSTTGIFPLSELQNSHRLCFSSDLPEFLSHGPYGQHVRSFLCFYDQSIKMALELASVILDNFTKLRILESRCIKLDKFPLKVAKLIHLRYLTLHIDTLNDLPEQITLLWNLQSLVVETLSRTITVKADMWSMIRLRYLKTKAVFVLDNSKWTGNGGENLHTLNRLAPESCTEAVSKKAKNLRILGVSGKLTHIFKTKFLENLRFLEKLKLVNSLAYDQTSEDVQLDLPRRNCFPPNLKRLTLSHTSLSWDHMSTLAMIESLEVLKLRDDAFVGVMWSLGSYNFPNLQLLHISNLTEFVLWDAPDKAFPELKFLLVENCENLKEIPESVGTHLEKLELECVRSSVVKSAQRIEESEMAKPNRKFNLIIGPACGTK